MTLHTCTRSLVNQILADIQIRKVNVTASKVQTKAVGNNIRCGKFFGMI